MPNSRANLPSHFTTDLGRGHRARVAEQGDYEPIVLTLSDKTHSLRITTSAGGDTTEIGYACVFSSTRGGVAVGGSMTNASRVTGGE